MWLRELGVSGSRTTASVSLLDDAGRPVQWVVMVGRNGAGKSGFLEGVRRRRRAGTIHLAQQSGRRATRVRRGSLDELNAAIRGHARRCGIPELVLIDDVELHLDVHAQRQLRSFLTQKWPTTQFVVTTMSPAVAHAARCGELVKLQRVGKGWDLTRFRVDPARLTLAELLTSPLFELETADSPEGRAQGPDVWSPRGRLLRDIEAHLSEMRGRR